MHNSKSIRSGTIAVFICALMLLATALHTQAMFGFGDEEKIPGHWDGPMGSSMQFLKDGRGVMKSAPLIGTAAMTMNFNWSVHGGRLKMWGKDTTLTGLFFKMTGTEMYEEHAIVFHGSTEFILDKEATYTRTVEK